MFRTLAPASLIALVFAQEAAAFTPIADCIGWSATAPSGSDGIAQGTAVLQHLGSNGFEVVETSYDEDILPAGGGTFLLEGVWQTPLVPGTYRVLLGAVALFGVDRYVEYGVTTSTEFDCVAGGDGAPRTPGFWKNHEEAWPVSSLSLGGTTYSQECLLAFLDSPTVRDARVKLIHHLVAAKLNLLPNDYVGVGDVDPATITGMPDATSTIADTIALGDAYLEQSGTTIACATATLSGTMPTGATKSYVVLVKDALDVFNNGE